MNPIAQLYTPVQHAALWLGAVFHGLESFDDFATAAHGLAASHALAGDEHYALAGVVKKLRQVTAPLTNPPPTPEPILSLVLAGPGEPPPVEPGTAAAFALHRAGAGIVVRDPDPLVVHVLVPEVITDTPVELWDPEDGPLGQWRWQWFTTGKRPSLLHEVGPGDADRLLATATSEAATLIGQRKRQPTATPVDPRLTIGRLDDYFDYPGIPAATPLRTQQLLARADRVTAVVHTTIFAAGDHSLDGELFRLARPIRQARAAATNYALADFARSAFAARR
ncbi:hypothetical protein ACFPVT_05875 [Corynebacterium choanae]|uniref:hypothetical protein n=1 Tax=Corynebacterium choanae TaxID=1862358 RepID=UPI000F5102AB|nr:hypothetical protein [Corynebacterium choanae]